MSRTQRETFVVERYWPGVRRGELASAERRMRRIARDLAQDGVPVRVVSSTYIPADEVVLTLYEATDEDDVIELNRRSGYPVDRVRRVEVVSGTNWRRRDEEHT